MLYVTRNAEGQITSVSTESSREAESRWDWKDFATVEAVAAEASLVTGKVFLPVDSGNGVSPRFDIVEAPKVGDFVSYGIGSDRYPDGEIISISASYKTVKTAANTYRRRKNTASWRNGSSCSMIPGFQDYRDPSF